MASVFVSIRHRVEDMHKRVLYTGRQFLLGIIALQILNLSVGNTFSGDDDYDYSYAYNKTYDPTETAVEWIIELKYGQQPAFSYDAHEDGTKCLFKTFHWKTDLQQPVRKPVLLVPVKRRRADIADDIPLHSCPDIPTPPPECSVA
jgi:hypothetical protein